jgi:bacterioferritin (cytochrome b1)
MTPDPKVIKALDECLKYERTLEDCHAQYRQYFKRWAFHRMAQDFRGFTRWARHRKYHLMTRINQLDTIPGNDRYKVEVVPVNKAGDVKDVMKYFEATYEEARVAYDRARDAARDASDTVSAKLCGAHKAELECDLARVEAKLKRIEIVGAGAYLAHHMHLEN